MRIAISGASGLIGSALAESLLADGHEVLRLVRRPAHNDTEVPWHPGEGWVDTDRLSGADAVVHLAAAPIGPRRWTAAYERRIRDSRVVGTRTIATALAGMDAAPQRLLSASGINYYGDTGSRLVDEDSPWGSGFLADVVAAWEAETAPAQQAGVSVAHLRTAPVLSAKGGLLGSVLPLFRLGLGGRLASGEQYMSWITLDDEVGAIRFLLDHAEVTGPVNLCAPEPVTNAEYTRAVASALGRPAPFPVPAFALRAALGRFADEAVLKGTRARPTRLLEAGYTFGHPDLATGLAHLLRG